MLYVVLLSRHWAVVAWGHGTVSRESTELEIVGHPAADSASNVPGMASHDIGTLSAPPSWLYKRGVVELGDHKLIF